MPTPRFRRTTALLVAGAATLLAAPASAVMKPRDRDVRAERAQRPFDVRDRLQGAATAAPRPPARVRSARSALTRRLGRQAIVDVNALTGTVRNLGRLDGALAGPATGSPRSVALSYARANAAALGLTAADFASLGAARVRTSPSGITTVRWRQYAKGVPTFDNGLRVNLGRGNRVIGVQGSPVHGLAIGSVAPRLSAEAALRAVMASTGLRRSVSVRKRGSDVRRTTTFSTGDVARLVLFQGRTTQLAWSLTYRAESNLVFQAVVDASSGRVLHRTVLTKYAVNASVFDNYPGAPVGGTQRPQDIEPYLDAGATTLSGPFARTWLDINDDDAPNAGEEVAPGAYPFTDFTATVGAAGLCTPTKQCAWNPADRDSWETNKNEAAVQAHYFVSNFHDHLAGGPIGFTAASGNFEGDDPVLVNADDGADTAGDGGPDDDHIDNANMNTFPEGTSPVMQMYLFEPLDGVPFRAINGDDSSDVLYHEYTHGLSNRLVIVDDGFGALNTLQPGAMGEAWSDWYAKDYVVRRGLQTDTPTEGNVFMGEYTDGPQPTETGEPGTIRTEGLDCPVGSSADGCPGAPDNDEDGESDTGPGGYTYGDLGKIAGFPEVHADGEIWAQTLWDVRAALVAQAGSQTAGSDLAEQLITDGMRLSPPEPTFLDMRNSIIQADQATHGGANHDLLWAAFAARGMGWSAFATDGNDVAPIEAFDLPPAAGTPTGSLAGTVFDAVSGLPVAGIQVGIPGHDSDPSFAEALATVSGANGVYNLTAPAATYPAVAVKAHAGYDPEQFDDVTLGAGATTAQDITVRFNWASLAAGGEVADTNDDLFAPNGCGPEAAIDQIPGGYSAVQSEVDAGPHPGEPPFATYELPQAIQVTEFAMDPAATCGDDASATLKDYRIETSPDGTTFTVAKAGSFAPTDAGRMNVVKPDAGTQNVKFVRVTLLSPQSDEPDTAGELFVDLSAFSVNGAKPNQLPTGSLTASPGTVGTGQTVTLTAAFTDADSRITGYDWDFDGNGTVDQTTGGPSTTTTYGSAGSFSARVNAKDFRGGAGSASATVTVTGGTLPPNQARPKLKLNKSGKKGRLKFRVTCDSKCTGKATLTVDKKTAKKLKLGKKRTVGSVRFTLSKAGQRTVTVKLKKKVVTRMRAAKAKKIKPRLKVSVTDAEKQKRSSAKKVSIKR